jgi:hypothetical protein
LAGTLNDHSLRGAFLFKRDGDKYPEYSDDREPRSHKFELIFGTILILFALFGTVLAQTITLNSNDRVEFGQGIVTLKACDSFVSLTLNPSSATYSGTRANGQPYVNLSRVRGIKFSGLNTNSCAGKKIKIQLFNNETTNAMSLFTDSSSLIVNRVILAINSDKTISREDALTLVNGKGQDIGYFDDYQYVDYDLRRAEYTVIFTDPLALMADVTRVGLESTNA